MPVVVVLFLALAAAEDSSPPTLVHSDVQIAVRERPLVIEATITDENGVFDPVVLWRVGADGPFARTPLEDAGGGLFRATLPPDVLVADVDYFIEAYDSLGNGPARHGTEDLPVHVRLVAAADLPKPTEQSQATSEAEPAAEESNTMLYVGLGVGGAALVVVVAAAAVTAGVLVFLFMQPNTPPGDGEVTLTVDAPVPVTSALSSMATQTGRGAL